MELQLPWNSNPSQYENSNNNFVLHSLGTVLRNHTNHTMHSVTCNWVLPDESVTAFESISSNKQTLDVFWPSFTAIFIEENNAGYLGRGLLQCMIR